MTWPLAAQLGTHIPGFIGDSFVHLWTFEWVKAALLSGQSPFYTDLLFYPRGTSLIFHNIAWMNFLGWLILQVFVGGAAAYSLVHMGVLIFNGLATFLLAREVTRSDRAAFVSGLICAFWPFILSHQGHPNLIFIGWISLALIFIRRMFSSGRVRDALLVALFLVLTGITRLQLLIMAAPLIGLYVLFIIVTDKSARTWQAVKLLLLIAGVTVLCLLPLVTPLAASQINRTFPEDLFVDEDLYVTDLFGFVVPSRYHPLWGQQAFAISWQFAGNMVYVPFIGYITLALSILGSIGAWRKARFWTMAALFYGIFALGPTLIAFGRPTSIPLPYSLIEDWFLVQVIRHPERLNVMLSIPIAILAGLGVTVLLRQAWLRAHKTLLICGISLLIAAEYIIAFPTLELSTPGWYERIADEAGDFAILDLPMNMRERYDKQYMFYQATHKRPLVEGHISRPPRQAFDFIESVPILQGVRDERYPPDAIGDVSYQLHLLDEAGIRYLVLHKRFLRESHEMAWRKWLALKPIFEDDDIIVYKTGGLELGDDFSLYQTMLKDDGRAILGLVQADYAPVETVPGGWVRVDIWWGSGTTLVDDYSLCLNLTAESGSSIKAICEKIAPDRPTSQWQANELLRTQHLFQVKPEWSSGEYALTVTLLDDDGEGIGQEANLGPIVMGGNARTFDAPTPQAAADANWQNEISLVGFDEKAANDLLDFVLYWQALEDIDRSYKIFLHVRNASSGELAAQADYIPRAWTYPTDWWEAGEYIADPISLSLTDLPAGVYQVWLGIYDPDTGERLLVADNEGTAYPNNQIPLTSIDR